MPDPSGRLETMDIIEDQKLHVEPPWSVCLQLRSPIPYHHGYVGRLDTKNDLLEVGVP
jgi:hypothetical protein